MTTTPSLTDPALAAVVEARDWKRQAEVAELVAVLDWSTMHEVTDLVGDLRHPGLRLGGVGCPMVSEYDAWDLAAVLGRSPDSCTHYLGCALELRHRLPRLWQRVLALEVPVHRAFRIAEQTQVLPPAGADQVDRALARFAHTVTPAQVERTVAGALAEHCPEEAERRRRAGAETRRFDIDLDRSVPLTGVVEVHGVLDVPDALDFEAAVSATAQQLADLGSTDPLDARRAHAVGEIARAQLTLDLETSQAPGRGVTIHAHVRAGTDTDTDTDTATIDGSQATVLAQQLAAWCHAPGSRVTIRPVLDLAADLACDGYVPSSTLAEQVDHRDAGTCVFPYCTRRRTDRDHTVPFHDGGPTTTSNLALLCRGHHRAKTFSQWTYTHTRPGTYTWHSPAGATYTVDRTGFP